MYSLPSMSTRRLPSPFAMNGGTPPTARNARTGLLTPPGITLRAASNAAADFCVDRDDVVSLMDMAPVFGDALRTVAPCVRLEQDESRPPPAAARAGCTRGLNSRKSRRPWPGGSLPARQRR